MEPDPGIALHLPTLERYASNAAAIIELGCGPGSGSTKALSDGLSRSVRSDKVHISVDIDPKAPWAWRPQVHHHWQFVHGDTRDRNTMNLVFALVRWRAADIIFIDTIHNADQIELELPLWQIISDYQTHWLFHDTWEQNRGFPDNYNPMTDTIKAFATAHAYRYEDLSKDCNGLGHMWKP